jgi:hypothetical protein
MKRKNISICLVALFFLICTSFLFFRSIPKAEATGATCTWTGAVNSDMNNAANYSGTGCTLDATDDLVFNSGSVAATASANIHVKSITVTSGYTGDLSFSGHTATYENGDASFDGTGTVDLGDRITINGASAAFHIGSGVGTVRGGDCDVIMNGTTAMTFDVDRLVIFKTLTLGANAKVANTGSEDAHFSSATTPFTMGASSTFTVNQTTHLFLSGSSAFMSLGAGYTINGSSDIRLEIGDDSIVVTLPAVTTVNIPIEIRDVGTKIGWTFRLTGAINLGTASFSSFFAYPNTAGTFDFNNQNVTCGTFTTGIFAATNAVTFNYGSGSFSITSFNGSDYNGAGTCNENFQTSHWTVAGTGWTFGSNHTINPGTSLITFTNSATITPNGKSFYDLALNASGKTITLADNINVHNFNNIAGTLAGAFTVTASGDVTVSTDTTFNRLIMTKPTTRTITVGAGDTLTLTNLTNTDLDGSAGALTQWRSGTPASPFNLIIPSPVTLTYQNPQDCISSQYVTANDGTSVNSGNNVKWLIDADVDPPVISAISASLVGANVAAITWTTNEPASSTVSYGTSPSYTLASSSIDFVTLHSINLHGLTAGTTYHFRVESTDFYNNRAVSSDYIFDMVTTQIYRSVGVGGENEIASGTATALLTIDGSGNATFSGTTIPDRVGVGDAIVYDSNNSNTITAADSVVFIHGRNSNNSYIVKTEAGFNVAATTAANDTWAIYRAYTSLAKAENSINNPSILPSYDTWSGGKDLTSSSGANQVWNIACYGDAADTTVVDVNGWTTDSQNYIRIYTPYLPSEVGVSQRHSGKWDDSKYRMEIVSNSSNALDIGNVAYAKIDGLQIKVKFNTASGAGIGASGHAAAWISNNIIWGALSVNGNNVGISSHDQDSTAKIYGWNNIIYGFKYSSSLSSAYQGGIFCDTGDCYYYNNTVYDCDKGFLSQGFNFTIKNNISYSNNDNYANNFSASSTNNLSGPSQISGNSGSDSRTSIVSFANETNKDFHLSPCDVGARDYGVDLSGDKYIPFSTDIEGQIRAGAWDIGADEYVSDNIRGYAWSSNYGWISMSCQNDFSCGASNYGVKICNTTCAASDMFNFQGYAWSSSAGWISFDSTGAPDYDFSSHCKNICNSSNNCTACFNPNDGKIYGWAKIISLGDDGWIRLGTTTMSSGLSIDQTSAWGQFHGWGWNGNTDPYVGAGWISFNCAETGNCATSNYFVYLDSPHLPPPINLSSPNWSYANACPAPGAQSGVALNAFLRWQFNNPYVCLSPTAFQVIVNTSNSTTSPLIDTGKRNYSATQYVASNTYGILQYDKPYYWWVKVWDNFGFVTPWVQFDSATPGHVLTDNSVRNGTIGNSKTFTTYRHEFPEAAFSWVPKEPLTYFPVTSTMISYYYDSSAPNAPIACDVSHCSSTWNGVNVFSNSTPTSSSTVMSFFYGPGASINLKVEDIGQSADDDYSCSSSTPNFFVDILPFWLEKKASST